VHGDAVAVLSVGAADVAAVVKVVLRSSVSRIRLDLGHEGVGVAAVEGQVRPHWSPGSHRWSRRRGCSR
ncbi:hypothetical protein ACFLVS_06415, partial [Chloroflexota bacterium]